MSALDDFLRNEESEQEKRTSAAVASYRAMLPRLAADEPLTRAESSDLTGWMKILGIDTDQLEVDVATLQEFRDLQAVAAEWSEEVRRDIDAKAGEIMKEIDEIKTVKLPALEERRSKL